MWRYTNLPEHNIPHPEGRAVQPTRIGLNSLAIALWRSGTAAESVECGTSRFSVAADVSPAVGARQGLRSSTACKTQVAALSVGACRPAKPTRSRLLLAASATLCLLLAGCASADRAERRARARALFGGNVYHALRADDPESRAGLPNPGRGFRIETRLARRSAKRQAASMRVRLASATTDDSLHAQTIRLASRRGNANLRAQLEAWRREGVTVAQAYCYLDEFSNAPLSSEMLARIDASLATVRAAGAQVILRFAYERNTKRAGGPRLTRILQHIDQLRPLLRRNADVILAVQEGFIGAWGEGHHATYIRDGDPRAHAAVLRALLAALPPDRMVQVRLARYKRMFLDHVDAPSKLKARYAHSGRPEARVGYHDDGLLAGKTDGGTFRRASRRDRDFRQMSDESPFVPVDGELFWSDRGWPDRGPGTNHVDGWRAAQRMRLHHYSTFSLTHSNSRFERGIFSIDRWKRTPISLEQVRDADMPASDAYFTTAGGRRTTRSAYEYIRDHLGYRIELQRAWLPATVSVDEPAVLEAAIINRGFAAPFNSRPVLFVLIDASGRVMPIKTDADLRTWQPFEPGDSDFEPLIHRIRGRIGAGGLRPGRYRVGLWLPARRDTVRLDPRYAIRLANRDTPWWTSPGGRYGVNLLGEINVIQTATPPASAQGTIGQ